MPCKTTEEDVAALINEMLERPIEESAKVLKLSKEIKAVGDLMRACTNMNLSADAALKVLVGAMAQARRGSTIEMWMRMARFPKGLMSQEFDYGLKFISETRAKDLQRCEWIGKGENVLLIGASGLGKTLMSVKIGMQAIEKGYNTCFIPANALLAELKGAEVAGSLSKALDRYIKPKLLILDDVGPVTEKADYSHVIYELFNARYVRDRSTLITTNMAPDVWGQTMGNAERMAAAIDRFMERAHIVKHSGTSYRLRRCAKLNNMKESENWNETVSGTEDVKLTSNPS